MSDERCVTDLYEGTRSLLYELAAVDLLHRLAGHEPEPQFNYASDRAPDAPNPS